MKQVLVLTLWIGSLNTGIENHIENAFLANYC